MQTALLKLFVLLLCTGQAFSQPMYNMSNNLVDDCEGMLLDSDEGNIPGNYAHNENLTFTICVPGADQIQLQFLAFCTEPNFDTLRVFDGPDTLSAQIGITYSGTTLPPVITSTGPCLTIHFASDANVACSGWVALWETLYDEPVPPNMLLPATVPCESNSLTLTFSDPVPCSAVVPGAFTLSGPGAPGVQAANPGPCTDGFTQSVTLTLNAPIEFSGSYQADFVYVVTICDTDYILDPSANFTVNDCPLNVEIIPLGQACDGVPFELLAVASGGDAGSYQFIWTPTPLFTTDSSAWFQASLPGWYYVTVSDQFGASATDSIFITPLPLPEPAIGDTSFCQSADPFTLSANPPGGLWFAAGVDSLDAASGLYQPALAGAGVDSVWYVAPNGCVALSLFTLQPLDPGPDQAACIDAAPFQLANPAPPGGNWSGPNVTPGGLFSPPPGMAGSFTLFYTHPNGCSGEKQVFVDDPIVPVPDTLCQSAAPITLNFSPPGGVWTGSGITNASTGQFDPQEANTGNNPLIYTLQGCTANTSIFVNQISAGNNITRCPAQAPFILPGNWGPPGAGTWSGLGVIDPITGLFDPSGFPHGANITLTYTVGGCTATRLVRIRETRVNPGQWYSFCPEDGTPFELNDDNTGRVPGGGVWTGTGIVNAGGGNYFFHPNLAGPGIHLLTYTANTCSDTMSIQVHPSPQITPASFCVADPPAILQATPAGGSWSGPGIQNELTGLFSPAAAGAGNIEVFYTSPQGCSTSAFIDITGIPQASIQGLDPNYCFINQQVPLQLNPPGGTLLVNGQPSAGFNPAQAGTGIHVLVYQVGQGACSSQAQAGTNVGSPIVLASPQEPDTLCPQTPVTLTASASGGSSNGNFTYTWNQGLGFGQTHYVTPTGNITYSVTVSDGCSDPVVASYSYVLLPSFNVGIALGDRVCFGEITFAEASAQPSGLYQFEWNTRPPTEGSLLVSTPGNYELLVTDENTGCQLRQSVSLPGYGPVQANFDLNPRLTGCFTTLDPPFDILDFSQGASSGTWNFGDGTTLPYSFGSNVQHLYSDTGSYTITLQLENEGGCSSEFQRNVCVKYAHRLYAPNAMSPNGDGINDFFQFVGVGIRSIQWQIHNRYGALLFQGHSLEDAWDGHFQGERVIQGTYTVTARYTVEGSGIERGYSGFVTVVH